VQVSVTPVDDGGAADRQLLPVRMYEVQVRISWNEDGRERQVSLNSLRLGPRT